MQLSPSNIPLDPNLLALLMPGASAAGSAGADPSAAASLTDAGAVLSFDQFLPAPAVSASPSATVAATPGRDEDGEPINFAPSLPPENVPDLWRTIPRLPGKTDVAPGGDPMPSETPAPEWAPTRTGVSPTAKSAKPVLGGTPKKDAAPNATGSQAGVDLALFVGNGEQVPSPVVLPALESPPEGEGDVFPETEWPTAEAPQFAPRHAAPAQPSVVNAPADRAAPRVETAGRPTAEMTQLERDAFDFPIPDTEEPPAASDLPIRHETSARETGGAPSRPERFTASSFGAAPLARLNDVAPELGPRVERAWVNPAPMCEAEPNPGFEDPLPLPHGVDVPPGEATRAPFRIESAIDHSEFPNKPTPSFAVDRQLEAKTPPPSLPTVPQPIRADAADPFPAQTQCISGEAVSPEPIAAFRETQLPSEQEEGDAEKFAEPADEFRVNFSRRKSSSQKTFVTTEPQRLAAQPKGLGIDVAKPAPPMPARPPSPASAHPVSEYAGVVGGVSRDWPVPEMEMPPAAAPVASTHAAVEAVLRAVDHVATREQHAVSLRFSVGDAELKVRVELRADEVRTTFTTDSAELRTALSHEWQAAAHVSSDGGVRIAPATFVSSGQAPSNPFSGDAASSHRQQQHTPRDVGMFLPQRGAGTAAATVARNETGSADARISNHASSRHLSTLA